MAVRKLDKYINDIENKLFPALKESINLIMYNDPVYASPTVNTYAGDLYEDRVKMEVSSNHVELADYTDKNAIFATIYYKSRGSKIGVLNLDDINECVGLIYATLYELGFRTPEDLEKEKKEKEEKEKVEYERKKAEAEKKRQERKARQQAEQDKEKEEIINDISIEEESKKSIEEELPKFDIYLNKLKEINSKDSFIINNISVQQDVKSYKVINITAKYIDKDNCFVETNGINPKIEKEVSWKKTKDYIKKVTEKVTGVLSVDAIGPDGKEINIEELKNNDINLDINL